MLLPLFIYTLLSFFHTRKSLEVEACFVQSCPQNHPRIMFSFWHLCVNRTDWFKTPMPDHSQILFQQMVAKPFVCKLFFWMVATYVTLREHQRRKEEIFEDLPLFPGKIWLNTLLWTLFHGWVWPAWHTEVHDRGEVWFNRGRKDLWLNQLFLDSYQPRTYIVCRDNSPIRRAYIERIKASLNLSSFTLPSNKSPKQPVAIPW